MIPPSLHPAPKAAQRSCRARFRLAVSNPLAIPHHPALLLLQTQPEDEVSPACHSGTPAACIQGMAGHRQMARGLPGCPLVPPRGGTASGQRTEHRVPRALQQRRCSPLGSLHLSSRCDRAALGPRLFPTSPCGADVFLTSRASACRNNAVPSQQRRLCADGRQASLQPRRHKSKEHKSQNHRITE